MTHSNEELHRLAGPDFNRILAEDPVLKELEAQRYDKSVESFVLLEVLGLGDYRIGKLPVRPLTAARWAFLWMLDNHFTTGGEIRQIDLDTALYVLSAADLRKMICRLSDLPGSASGYATVTRLSPEEVCMEVQAMIRTAFHPLSMLPPCKEADDESGCFDGIWATRIAGIAARESGMPLDRCMHEMSLSCICCLYVNWLRRESLHPEQIRRRPDAEIELRIGKRVEELSEKFLREKSKDTKAESLVD